MTALVTTRAHRLADALAELKVKVRAALATELAGAVGSAVRDVLFVALIDRVTSQPRASTPAPLRGGWQGHGYARQRDSWDESRDPWADSDDDMRSHVPARCTRDEHDERAAIEPAPVAPAAALAIGVNVGRWWLGRGGTGASAIGFGLLATALGLAGGPVARAALAVLAAAADVLTAESVLARPDPF
jgi:hypothetical protein